MAEPVKKRHLLLAVEAHRVVRRELLDQLSDTGAQLVGEVRRGGADERVDVVTGRRHGTEANSALPGLWRDTRGGPCQALWRSVHSRAMPQPGLWGSELHSSHFRCSALALRWSAPGEGCAVRGRYVRGMRRPTTVELMLLTTVLLWALNLTVTRYILTHGMKPLAYATVRYSLAAAIFVLLTLVLERTLRIDRKAAGVMAAATALLVTNQLGFVYSLERTTASTVGLILGATPIFAALFGLALDASGSAGASGSARSSRSAVSRWSPPEPVVRCRPARAGSCSPSSLRPRGLPTRC